MLERVMKVPLKRVVFNNKELSTKCKVIVDRTFLCN